MNATRLLICDKDGTLVSPASAAKFVGEPWDQKPLPAVEGRLAEYVDNGWEIAIASNQAGIAAGHKSLENCILEMKFCLKLIPTIQEAYFCPDFDGNECWQVWDTCTESEGHRILHGGSTNPELRGLFRKPNPGMLLAAMENFRGAEEVLYIGDRPEDEAAALAANIPFLWANDFFGVA